MNYYKATNIGLVRKTNEDALIAEEELGLFGVADGMGGHQAGEVASGLAVQSLVEYLRRYPAGSGNPSAALTEAVREANERVFSEAQKRDSFRGMGTTVTAGLFDRGRLSVAHVGDSRAYLIRGGNMERLTTDHSLVFELLKNGGISAEEAFQHPQRNVLTRALGTSSEVRIDARELEVSPGDRVLFCTDGLSGHLREDVMRDIICQNSLEGAGEQLLAAALQEGGTDNISLVLVDVE